jgi:ribosomal protein S18 acetylase RimI-like enzyme
MIIRLATKLDATQILLVMNDAENSGFMLANPGERNLKPESIEKIIGNINGTAESGFFVAELNEAILGYMIVRGDTLERTSHRASIVIGVHSTSRGKGVGTALFEHVFEWAKQKEFHRLELTVIESNEQALGLYKKMGFEMEGIRKDALVIEGKYVNEMYMGKIL